MAKQSDVLRDAIGKTKFDRIKTFAQKSKAGGKSPDEVRIAIQKKFGKNIKVANTSSIIGPIIANK